MISKLWLLSSGKIGFAVFAELWFGSRYRRKASFVPALDYESIRPEMQGIMPNYEPFIPPDVASELPSATSELPRS